ncbi:MAG: ribose-phosphate diphosphokinase [Gammaproteobacteria bacterium]|nr:ribose-phosphate diphosphokinase [Gammaproteobacteria bacterium]MDH5650913.1 ribose-phosphate diphosphokinase [Gammaproteobacteria bacterium]
MQSDTIVLGFADYREPAQRYAAALGLAYREVDIHHFPDQESRIILPQPLPTHLILCRSMFRPNDKLVELMLIVRSARRQGVRRISLIAPYLCYMRQDKAFHPGEVVSQTVIGGFLAELFDAVITVDPHLHRITNLDEAIPGIQAVSLHATAALGKFLVEQANDFFLIGPDEESEQWVAAIAEQGGYEFAIAHKTRFSDTEVRVVLPELQLSGRDVVLVDDMVSTGHTMIETAQQLPAQGVNSVSALITHPLFTDNALHAMQQSGINRIWSSDSIPHATNCVMLADLLASASQTLPELN